MVDGKFEKVEGSDRELPADLRVPGDGLRRPREGFVARRARRASSTPRGNVARDDNFMSNVPGVFVAGDMGRGQSLIVWAIAEGRSAAAGADRYLMGETKLPEPIEPDDPTADVTASGAARRRIPCPYAVGSWPSRHARP